MHIKSHFGLISLGFVCLALQSKAATWVVTNLENSGAGSLRQAILDANATPELDIIHFNIQPPGAHTISPRGGLPRITAPLTIDGTTQPGYNGLPLIELEGSNSGTSPGLHLVSGQCTVRGLVINRFGQATGNIFQAGILLDGRGTNVIEGNFIGTDLTGTFAMGPRQNGLSMVNSTANRIGGPTRAARNLIAGNGGFGISIFFNSSRNVIQGNYIGTDISGSKALGNGGNGINLNGVNNLIGGLELDESNLISGNQGSGLEVFSSDNRIQGNFIGTDHTGTRALGNLTDGITVSGGSRNLIGGPADFAGNIISGNFFTGITIRNNAAFTIVQGNFVGTDLLGRAALGNGDNGIHIGNSRNNIIGGLEAGERNVISGNRPHGVEIFGSNSRQNEILGNLIGTDATGTVAIRNSDAGVSISDARNNTIGGTARAARNVISANGSHGIQLMGAGARANAVLGNNIGTEISGRSGLPNLANGVFIDDGSSGNLVGGIEPGSANVIAFNQRAGIQIRSGITNALRGNLIFSNAGLGIDLGQTGPSVGGSADFLAAPLLTAVQTSSGQLQVQGRVEGPAQGSLELEFFASVACHSSGYGQGERFLGSQRVELDASGRFSFGVLLPGVVDPGQIITATATDALGNTSEFSKCLAVGATVQPPPAGPRQLLVTSDPGGKTLTLSWPADGQNWVLEQAENLGSPSAWAGVTGSPTASGSTLTFKVNLNSPTRFYRLRRP